MKTQTQVRPLPIPNDYPHDSCDWPTDMIMAAKPSQMAQRLKERGHKVDCSDPDWLKVHHSTMPWYVRFFRTTDDRPYRVQDRARILRALKLFAFFCLLAALIFHQQLAGAWHQLTAFAASHIL